MGLKRFARFSLAGLIAAIGLLGVGLACLMFASTAWAGAVWSVTLGILTLAPLGIIYRGGERRAFWTGVVLCGWSYLTLSAGPWFVDHIRPRLVTSKLLVWAYPWMIPAARRPENPRFDSKWFTLPSAALEGGLTIDVGGGERVDVWVKGEGEASPSLLVADVQAVGTTATGPNTISRVTLATDAEQFLKLQQAGADSRPFVLRPHQAGPLDPLWSSPPVGTQDFEDVGHRLFTLLCAWMGGLAGRSFFATGAAENLGAPAQARPGIRAIDSNRNE
jgi:hypothetical protein